MPHVSALSIPSPRARDRRVRRAGLVVALVAGLLPGTAVADWVRIAAWNIEHLGSTLRTHQVPGIAELIFLSGADVIAMSEIYDTDHDPDSKANAQLNQVIEQLNAIPGNAWTYEMLPNRNPSDESQLVTVAWNQSRVTKLGSTFRVPIERDPNHDSDWDRHPHALQFRVGTASSGKTDFVLIPVHMKADFRCDCAPQRGREAALLAAQIGTVKSRFGDKDVLILGDLNADAGDEPGVANLVAAGFRDLNWVDATTHPAYGPLDRILVPDHAGTDEFEEFRFSDMFVLQPADAEQFDTERSDHLLVITPVKVMADDD